MTVTTRVQAAGRLCGGRAAARLSADGRVHPFALRRSETPDRRDRRAWRLDVALDFDPTSLAEHCLARCQGFLVDTVSGDEVGVVHDVRVDAETGAAAAIAISSGWFGRRRLVLPVESVSVVLPHEARLLVESPRPRARRGAQGGRRHEWGATRGGFRRRARSSG